MKNLTLLKEMIVDFFKDDKVKIIIFGSRAREDNYPNSDVDIGIIPYERLDAVRIAILKERIENSNIPYKVEIVNFLEVSEEFKKEALKEVIIWKD